MTKNPSSFPGSASPQGVSRRTVLASAAAGFLAASAGGRGAMAATGPLETVKIGMANSVMTVIYPYITNTQQFGLFAEEGVNVELILGQGTPQILSLLLAGTVDMAFCNPEQVVQMIVDRSQNLKSIFAPSKGDYLIATMEDSPIRTVEQLKGKRIGMFTPQSGINYLKGRLTDAGLTTDDISIVPISFGGQAIAAIRQKQVDAVVYWKDALALMGLSGLKLREFPRADWEKDFYAYVGTVKQKTLEERPKALQATLRAIARGQMLSMAAPELTVETYWKRYPDQAPKPEARAAALEYNLSRLQQVNPGLPFGASKEQLMAQQWGNQSLGVWTRLQDHLLRVGAITHKIDPAMLFDNRFIEYANGFDRAKVLTLATAK